MQWASVQWQLLRVGTTGLSESEFQALFLLLSEQNRTRLSFLPSWVPANSSLSIECNLTNWLGASSVASIRVLKVLGAPPSLAVSPMPSSVAYMDPVRIVVTMAQSACAELGGAASSPVLQWSFKGLTLGNVTTSSDDAANFPFFAEGPVLVVPASVLAPDHTHVFTLAVSSPSSADAFVNAMVFVRPVPTPELTEVILSHTITHTHTHNHTHTRAHTHTRTHTQTRTHTHNDMIYIYITSTYLPSTQPCSIHLSPPCHPYPTPTRNHSHTRRSGSTNPW